MLLEPVVTNGAAILTMIVLWSCLTSILVYFFMSKRVDDLREKISVLDWYCYESDRDLRENLEEIELLRDEVAGKDEYIRHLIRTYDLQMYVDLEKKKI